MGMRTSDDRVRHQLNTSNVYLLYSLYSLLGRGYRILPAAKHVCYNGGKSHYESRVQSVCIIKNT
jgi:hypothetical protein